MIYLLIYVVVCILLNFLFNYLAYWKNDPLQMKAPFLVPALSFIWPITLLILCFSIFISFLDFPYYVLVKILGKPK